MFGSQQSCLVQVLVPGRVSDTHAPCSVLLWERAVSSSLRLPAPLSACFVSCFVARSSFYWLRAMFLSCAVLHAACVFSMAACFHVCHVLCEHAAYESPH